MRRTGFSLCASLCTLVLTLVVALALVGCDGAGEPADDEPDSERDGPEISVDPLDTDRLVGAHYYPWYGKSSMDANWMGETPVTPALGAYDSRDPEVINQHVKWALEHGIQWFSMSWWGPGSFEDETLQYHFLEAELGQDIQFSILYETAGRFGSGRIDMDATEHRQRLREDLAYLAETYFQRDNYLRIDGRPVVFFYIAHTFEGDVAAAFQEASSAVGVEPYVIADVPFGSAPDVYRIAAVADAVSTYNPYTARDDIEAIFHDWFEKGHATLHLAAETNDFAFIPVAFPGYDDTEITHVDRPDHPILEASPDRFEQVGQQLQVHLDAAPAVLITSFNEWYENTQIEPHEEFGTAYLDHVADYLATGSGTPFEPDGITVRLQWDQTQSEQERNPDALGDRDLAFMCFDIRLLDESGEMVASYDVGRPDAEPLFAAGTYGAESDGDRSWRWFGGPHPTTVFLASGINSVSTIELQGRPVFDMAVDVTIGDQMTTATVTASETTHRIDL